MRLVAVAVVGAGLAHVARFGVDHRDDAFLRDPAHDAPATHLVELDVLTRDEREQTHRRGALHVLDVLAGVEETKRVTHQRVDELAARLRRPRQ